MKFSIKHFFIKCDQIRSFLKKSYWKKSLMKNFGFCTVSTALARPIFNQIGWHLILHRRYNEINYDNTDEC